MSAQYWIETEIAVWDAIAPGETATAWLSPYTQANRAYNTHPAGKVIYRVLCTKAEVDAIVAALNVHTPGSSRVVMGWDYATGAPDKVNHVQDAAELVSLMPDQVVYDENGDPVATPPTDTSPNFALRYAGDGEARLSYFDSAFDPRDW